MSNYWKKKINHTFSANLVSSHHSGDKQIRMDIVFTQKSNFDLFYEKNIKINAKNSQECEPRRPIMPNPLKFKPSVWAQQNRPTCMSLIFFYYLNRWMTRCLSILFYFLKNIDDMSSKNPVSSHHRGDQKILIGIVLLENLILTDFHIKTLL